MPTEGAAILLVLPLLAGAVVPSAAAEDNEAVLERRVFHHLCENPTLQEILVHRSFEASEGQFARGFTALCEIGGYGFVRGRIEMELSHYAGVGRIWIFVGDSANEDGTLGELLMAVFVSNRGIIFHQPPGDPVRIANIPRYETIVVVTTERGRVRIQIDGQSRQFQTPSPGIRLDGPVHLVIPASQADCAECRLMALDVYLRGDLIAESTKTLAVLRRE